MPCQLLRATLAIKLKRQAREDDYRLEAAQSSTVEHLILATLNFGV